MTRETWKDPPTSPENIFIFEMSIMAQTPVTSHPPSHSFTRIIFPKCLLVEARCRISQKSYRATDKAMHTSVTQKERSRKNEEGDASIQPVK